MDIINDTRLESYLKLDKSSRYKLILTDVNVHVYHAIETGRSKYELCRTNTRS